MSEARADYDSPWKEAVERYFEDFVAFLFPEVHGGVNWEMGYEFLYFIRDKTL